MDLTIFTARLKRRRLHPEEYEHLVGNGGSQAQTAAAPPRWLNNFWRGQAGAHDGGVVSERRLGVPDFQRQHPTPPVQCAAPIDTRCSGLV